MTDSLITPAQMLALAARGAGLEPEDLAVRQTVVGSWGRGLVEQSAASLGAAPLSGWPNGHRYPVFQAPSVTLVHYAMGASATVRAMEELAAAGARRFLTLGWLGSLQTDLPVGSLVIPTAAVSEEGTSAHYAGPATAPSNVVEAVRAQAGIQGLEVRTGRVWTTDAMYRETRDKVSRYASEGVLGVDMETAAMLSFGAFRGVEVCNLLVVSDELRDIWVPGFGDPRHMQGTVDALAVLLAVAQAASGSAARVDCSDAGETA
jgi:uridine phosphorylase